MHRWRVGLALAEPAYRKRRRRALTAGRKARRRERRITEGMARSESSARTATLPLDIGPALIVILLLSLGLWMMIWAAVALAAATPG
jgi:Flp pilus assembly protein TadB